MKCVHCQTQQASSMDAKTNILFCGASCQTLFYQQISGKAENNDASIAFLKSIAVPKIDSLVGETKFTVDDASMIKRVFRVDAEDELEGYNFIYHVNYLSYLLNVCTSYLNRRDLKRIMNVPELRILKDDTDAYPGTILFAYMFLRVVEKILADSGFAINRELDVSQEKSDQKEYPSRQQWIDQHGGANRLKSFLTAYNTKTGQFCTVQKSLTTIDCLS